MHAKSIIQPPRPASRVVAGDSTPLEEKELRLKILTEEIRREKAESRLEKQREKVRKQLEKEGNAARKKTSATTGGAPAKRHRSTSTPGGEGEYAEPLLVYVLSYIYVCFLLVWTHFIYIHT